MVVHLPQGRTGPRGGHVAAGGGPDRDRQGLHRRGAPSRTASTWCCPTDVVVAPESSRSPTRTPRPEVVEPPTRCRPTRWAWTSARSPQKLFARQARRSAKTVAWNGPMGVFEVPTLSPAVRSAVAEALVRCRCCRRILRRRRRRLRRRRAQLLGFAGGRLLAHLHRWRRLPRAPRGRGSPGLKVLD